jgi:hypothetical protein
LFAVHEARDIAMTRKLWDFAVITPEDFGNALAAAFLGDQKAHAACFCIRDWFIGLRTTEKDKKFMCISCETVFEIQKPPAALILITPMFEGTHAVISGICTKCYEKNENRLDDYVVESTRRWWPDVEHVQMGNA